MKNNCSFCIICGVGGAKKEADYIIHLEKIVSDESAVHFNVTIIYIPVLYFTKY